MNAKNNTGDNLIEVATERVNGKNGKLFTSALKKLVNSNEEVLKQFLYGEVWKSIYVGGKSANFLMKELVEINFKIEYNAKFITMQKQFSTSVKSRKVDFAKKSLKEFGFTGTTFAELLQFFRNHPIFELCQPEDAYYLRMAYNDQPKGECVEIAMFNISDSPHFLDMFYLEHDANGMCIYGDWCRPLDVVDPDSLWIARIRIH